MIDNRNCFWHVSEDRLTITGTDEYGNLMTAEYGFAHPTGDFFILKKQRRIHTAVQALKDAYRQDYTLWVRGLPWMRNAKRAQERKYEDHLRTLQTECALYGHYRYPLDGLCFYCGAKIE